MSTTLAIAKSEAKRIYAEDVRDLLKRDRALAAAKAAEEYFHGVRAARVHCTSYIERADNDAAFLVARNEAKKAFDAAKRAEVKAQMSRAANDVAQRAVATFQAAEQDGGK